MIQQLELLNRTQEVSAASSSPGDFLDAIRAFAHFGTATEERTVSLAAKVSGSLDISEFTNEFWTAKQRAGHSLHEISYRACFKPQLPRFFIERLTRPGDCVYDPFSGRGTTVVEAQLLGRDFCGTDISPLFPVLTWPRLFPVTLELIGRRLSEISLEFSGDFDEELLAFYHPTTLTSIYALREYFFHRIREGLIDDVDAWIRMVALNRLTGHSTGFFSVYTMPPNQAVTAAVQRKINEKRCQVPEPRDVKAIILRKSKSLLRDVNHASFSTRSSDKLDSKLHIGDAAGTPHIPSDSIQLVVTSPPFLDVVDYASDNWLRCWFIGVNATDISISILRKLEAWEDKMRDVLRELYRVIKPSGFVAFEVGEVRGGKIELEKNVAVCGHAVGLNPIAILINSQDFTKTANCWGVSNNKKGTNSNRIVLFQKPK